MSEKEGQPGRPADENLDGSHVVRDGVGDQLPYRYLPRESRSVQVDRQGLGILVEASELLLIGTVEEMKRPRYIGLAPTELITYSDLLKFLVTLHNLTSLEAGVRRLPPAASAGRLLLTASSVTPKPPYPSMSKGMLSYTERVKDRALMGGLRPPPFKNADASSFLHPSLSQGMLRHLKILHEQTTDRIVSETVFPGNKGELPGVITGDLYDPTLYIEASGDELRTRRLSDPTPSNLPTMPRVARVALPDRHPYPEQLSDNLGNPPVRYLPIPPPLPPKT